MAYFLVLQGLRGCQVVTTPGDGQVEITDNPDLQDILRQPFNYALDDADNLSYSPQRSPGEFFQWVDGRYRLNTELLDRVRAQVWEQIKARRDNRKDGGVKVSGKWFHTDAPSRVQHLGLRMLGNSIPPGLMWKTMDGSFVEMTPALSAGIFVAVLTQDTQIFAVAEQHRLAVYQSEDPHTHDFTTGWPPIFGE